jgi:hypothetical protein
MKHTTHCKERVVILVQKQLTPIQKVFEQYAWCKNAFARDINGLGIPAIGIPRNKEQPVAFSLTGAIHYAYQTDAIPIIYKCKEYLDKQYKFKFTVDEWQDNQPDFKLISKLIEDLQI